MYCSECRKINHAAYKAKYPGRSKLYKRNSDLRRMYGLEPEDYANLLARQGGVCGICQTADWRGRGPQIDHDHVTGRIRGVLCIRCNRAIGLLLDDPLRIEAALAYVREWRGSSWPWYDATWR